ncbi:Oxysterol-binding protein 4 [Naganishia albida]|nr:Oxysterol-binding protein 4 [Naganishia albida]
MGIFRKSSLPPSGDVTSRRSTDCPTGDSAVAGTDVVPTEQKAGWTSFIKSLASMTGDLSSMTAPPFILSPTSLTEFPAYWGERPELFADIAQGRTEQDRMEKVLRWFICTLKGQYTTRNEKMGSEKKPLNPVLGEQFFGVWPDAGYGETTLTVEQVSHHPPITAYFIQNQKAGVTLQGHSGQKTSFSGGSINVKQNGHATLTVSLPGGKRETYLITLPRLQIQGLVWGSPYIELADTTAIVSDTGYIANIEYKGKGWVSGKAHSFKAVLSHNGKTVRSYEGNWTAIGKVSKTDEVFTDATVPKTEVTVKPIEQQGDWESRRLWAATAQGIRSGDYESASRDKSRIENEQRQRRKDEAASGQPWQLRLFEHVDSDPVYKQLAAHVKGIPSEEDAYIFRGFA